MVLRRRLLEGLDQKDLIIEDYVSGFSATSFNSTARKKAHVDDWDPKV